MPKLDQRGIIQFIVLLILLLGIGGAVFLVTRSEPFKIFPKAGRGPVSGPVVAETSFTLVSDKSTYNEGETASISLNVRSDIDPANLFDAKINYDHTMLQLRGIDISSFITNWVETYRGDPGKISLVGGVPAPGFQTQVNSAPAKMATLIFAALKSGSTSITFAEGSAIYRNSDNIDILGIKNGVTITIGSAGSPTSTPIPTPLPTASPGIGLSIDVTNIDVTIQAGSSAQLFYITSTGATQFVLFGYPTTYGPGINWLPASGGIVVGQSIPISIQVNSNIPAGTYTGTGIVKDQTDRQLTIPVKVTVTTTPLPSATPKPGTGDGNNDGKINLVDLSVLLTDFNKGSDFRKGIDLNSDGKINTFDFSLMRNLLIQKGVIKG